MRLLDLKKKYPKTWKKFEDYVYHIDKYGKVNYAMTIKLDEVKFFWFELTAFLNKKGVIVDIGYAPIQKKYNYAINLKNSKSDWDIESSYFYKQQVTTQNHAIKSAFEWLESRKRK